MRLVVRTTAAAVVDEEWIIDVDDELGEKLLAEPYEFETYLATEQVDVVTVHNVAVRDEEDRDVTSIEIDDESVQRPT